MSIPATGRSVVNDFYVLPDWLRQEVPDKAALEQLYFFRAQGLNTVCQQAKCPNWTSCFKENQASFLILGDTCTRNCSFCNVKKGRALEASLKDEPLLVRDAVKALRLEYVVVTSVTRDDLDDGGASCFAETVKEIRGISENIKIEILIPDFAGSRAALKTVLDAGAHVIGHNLETVPRLYPLLRPKASYSRSLGILDNIKMFNSGIITKSALLLGMGEREEEVVGVVRALVLAGCDILTLGQYLAPSPQHYPVAEFITPQRFDYYRDLALSFGIKHVLSGPKVRSSYKAQEVYNSVKLKVWGHPHRLAAKTVPPFGKKDAPKYA